MKRFFCGLRKEFSAVQDDEKVAKIFKVLLCKTLNEPKLARIMKSTSITEKKIKAPKM